MANMNESQTTESADTKTLKTTKSSVKPKRPSFNLTVFSLGLAGLALAAALYTCYTMQQIRQTSAQQTEAVTAALGTLKQQQETGRNEFDQLVQTLKEKQGKMQTRMQELDKALQTAMQQQFYQKQDWQLLKARYYLELAQINAHWSTDQQTTIALLEQADLLLASLSSQQLFAVRQAIAKEITQLKAQPKLDIAGLLSQLDAAQNLVSTIPVKQAITKAETITKSDAQSTSPWREKLQTSLNTLEKLVVIRHHDEDINPILSPLHEAALRTSLRMNLQEAQWAVLQNNTAVYQFALTHALTTLKGNFAVEADQTQALIKQLEALQQVSLVSTKPKPEEALPLLNQLIDNGKATNTPAGTEGGKAL